MVLLISLKAGGVGLNLTNANHAFMVSVFLSRGITRSQTGGLFSDGLLVERGCRKSRLVVAIAIICSFRPTITLAIDRLHRVTQERTVYVKHFIVSRFKPLFPEITTLALLVPQIGNTIEGRILQIQKRKTAIVKEAFKGKGKDKGGEKHDAESMENLKIMFGIDADEVLAIAPLQLTQK